MNRKLGAILLPVVLSLLTVAAAQAASPPTNRTYFTIVLGLEGPASYEALCLSFTPTRMCTSDGHCGSWSPARAAGPADVFTLAMSFNHKGIRVRIDGRGQIEDRGERRHSLAGVARARIAESVVNFGFAGRLESPEECARSLEKWNEKNEVLNY